MYFYGRTVVDAKTHCIEWVSDHCLSIDHLQLIDRRLRSITTLFLPSPPLNQLPTTTETHRMWNRQHHQPFKPRRNQLMIDVVNGADKDKTLFFYVSSVFVVGESKSKPKPAAGGQLKARLQLFFRDNIMFHLIACHKGMLVHRRML